MEKIDIIVIGCGGTGSHYIKELGRFLYKNKTVSGDIRIVLVDGDTVETKNLTRQAFIEDDIGENKAKIMSEILGDIFKIECSYYDRYIDDEADIRKLVREDAVVLLIGCVDNHQCRQSMHYFFKSYPTCIYMDSANEYQVGEIVIGSRICGVEICPDRAFYFKEILEYDSKRSETSCEELNVSSPQHLLTNQFAALILLSNTVKFLSLEEEWPGGIIFFDSFQCYSQERTHTSRGEK